MSFNSKENYFKEFVIICFYLKCFWHELKFIKTYKQKIHVVQFFFLRYSMFIKKNI